LIKKLRELMENPLAVKIVREIVEPFTVLVVDDDEDILKFVGLKLKMSGYRVVTAGDGIKALEILRSDIVDLVVTDLAMPRLGGMQLIKEIRTFSTVPVIVLTAIDPEENKLEAMGNGADDYLTKPFDPDELVAHIGALKGRKIGLNN
jgi:DNA-binding response OmpR family regulator